MPDQYETRPSQLFGEYRLIRKLGGGGFGTVYLAEHIHEHSQVAIKILQVPLAKNEDFREFLNETRTMIRLHHPHITPLLDVGLSRNDFPFLVMEYASQGTVHDRHPRGSQLPLPIVVEYVEQIASALQYAHDHRIIHRDVKPENMLLRADGTLLLSDFGIAKIMERSTLISQQKQTGTPAYMAPEQHKGYPCFASDQYALAVVAYEWISGTRPFQGSREWLAVQHVTAQLPSLQNHIPTFPLHIERVLFKALSKEPEQRFATVQEFATAFRAAVQMTTVPDSDIQPLDTPRSQQLPTTTGTGAIQTKTEVNTPPAPPLPQTDQPTVPEITSIKQDPDPMASPISSDRPVTPQPITLLPISPTETTEKPLSAVKVSRRLLLSRRNSLLLGSLSLTGFIILVLFINLIGINLIGANVSHPQKSSQKSSHTNPVHASHQKQVLDASTVAHLGKKWTFQTASSVESSPAVVGGVVYAGSDDGSVYALDMLTGHQNWAFPTGGAVVSSPAVVNGVVYVGSDDGNVYAFDMLTGHQKWAFPTGSIVHSSPAVVDNVVYIGSTDGNVYAIDANTGQEKWGSYTGGTSSSQGPPPQGQGPPPQGQGGPPQGPPPVSSLPVIDNGVVYVGAPDNNVYALDVTTGQQKWVFYTKGAVVSSPAVANGVVYVGSLDKPGSANKHVYAIDAQSGQQKWVSTLVGSLFSGGDHHQGPPPSVNSSPVIVDGVIYIGADNSNVYALDAVSGQPKWISHTNGSVVSTPAVVNGMIYVGTLGSSDTGSANMYAIDMQSGNQKWSTQTGGQMYSSPVVANNAVYVGSMDGNVYAFGL